VPDGTVLSRRIKRLKNDEQRKTAIRIKNILQFEEFVMQ
jgi:hypothetical protein